MHISYQIFIPNPPPTFHPSALAKVFGAAFKFTTESSNSETKGKSSLDSEPMKIHSCSLPWMPWQPRGVRNRVFLVFLGVILGGVEKYHEIWYPPPLEQFKI